MEVVMKAGNMVHKDNSAGSPFHIYAPGLYQKQVMQNRAYAVEAGKVVSDHWIISEFENSTYHLQVYGPNGFFRELSGTKEDAPIAIQCAYETDALRKDLLTGNVLLWFTNTGTQAVVLEIKDNPKPAFTATVVLLYHFK